MKLSEADAYRLRALAAEATLAQAQAQQAVLALTSAFTALGLDSAKHGVVSRETPEHPIGTVIDLATGRPFEPPPAPPQEPAYASRAPKVKEEPKAEPRLPERAPRVATNPLLPDMPLQSRPAATAAKFNQRRVEPCTFCVNGDRIDQATGEHVECWACDGLGNAHPSLSDLGQ